MRRRSTSSERALSASLTVLEQKAHLIRGVGTGSFLKSQSGSGGSFPRKTLRKVLRGKLPVGSLCGKPAHGTALRNAMHF